MGVFNNEQQPISDLLIMEKYIDGALVEAIPLSHTPNTLTCSEYPKDESTTVPSSSTNNVDYYPGKIIQVSSLMRDFPNIQPSPVDNDKVVEFPNVHSLVREKLDELKSFKVHDDIAEYELIHRVHDNLGLIDPHPIDYAYRPVLASSFYHEIPPQRPYYQPVHIFSPHLHNNPLDILDESVKWLSNSHSRPRYRRDYYEDAESKYERVGNTAFAGGSHGEVWRARRRCNQVVRYECGRTGDTGTTNSQSLCDDKTELIMKRLKVEHGFDILEAGMREVYFGQLLLDHSHLFTHYLDHFFHEAFHGGEPELWLVFENAGVSLRSLLYTPLETENFFLYRQSDFWRQLRMFDRTSTIPSTVDTMDSQPSSLSVFYPYSFMERGDSLETDPDTITDVPSLEKSRFEDKSRLQKEERTFSFHGAESHRKRHRPKKKGHGNGALKKILKQILVSTAALHELGIIHRDIKPSNIVCKIGSDHSTMYKMNWTVESPDIQGLDIICKLADFSSAWDRFATRTLYTYGPSAAEQTDEYAPPEVLFADKYKPFDALHPESYDSWSIGVVALELLLGTPHVFSVDQRTTTLLTSRMERDGATVDQIRQALYLSALSQFCIYNSSQTSSWRKCTLQDFHRALRARDPLGIGLTSSNQSNALLELIWGLLAWEPSKRLTPKEALLHRYFSAAESEDLEPSDHNALELVATDPSIDLNAGQIHSFICPNCGRIFEDLNSCTVHARSRQHARFCRYDTTSLPPCLNTHPLLPNHHTSGYCDIQGRRQVIEDFHSIHLKPDHQFYGIFDGHNGNLASKYAASYLYHRIMARIQSVDQYVRMIEHMGLILLLLNDISILFQNDSLETNKYASIITHSKGWVPDLPITPFIFPTLFPIACKNSKSGMNDLRIKWVFLKSFVLPILWKRMISDEMIRAFEEVHMEILHAIGNSIGGKKGIMGRSGTTATVLFIFEEALVIANVGDSSAVMSVGIVSTSSGIKQTPDVVRLTVDHVASDPIEKQRIEYKGGKVVLSGGIERISGDLAISRSLGDAHLSQYLSQRPHVIALTMKEVKELCNRPSGPENHPCFIVLASDGLWDVMDPDEAVDMVALVLESSSWEGGEGFQAAAQALTHEAYVRGSTDNIGVCVVALE